LTGARVGSPDDDIALASRVVRPHAREFLIGYNSLELVGYGQQDLPFPFVPARLCLTTGAFCSVAILFATCHAGVTQKDEKRSAMIARCGSRPQKLNDQNVASSIVKLRTPPDG